MFKKYYINSCCNGFTLIEISIVLVIIGLLAGGILVGQNLIHAAELRSQIKQLQDYQIAFRTFQTKYNCVPGDCANATSFFGTIDANNETISNGDGNGFIDTETAQSYNLGAHWYLSTEISGVWQHLSLAQMINFLPININQPYGTISMPPLALNQNVGIFIAANYNFASENNPDISSYQKGNNALWMVACNVTAQQMKHWGEQCAIFTASDLKAIDSKIDDGTPLGGNFIGFGGYDAGNNFNNCLNINGVNSTYNLSIPTAQCEAAYIIN